MNNKKLVVLSLVLVILIVVAFFRWETIEVDSGSYKENPLFVSRDISYYYITQKDRLTSKLSVQGYHDQKPFTRHQDPFLTHTATLILYSAMGYVLLVLIKEVRLIPQKNKEE